MEIVLIDCHNGFVFLRNQSGQIIIRTTTEYGLKISSVRDEKTRDQIPFVFFIDLQRGIIGRYANDGDTIVTSKGCFVPIFELRKVVIEKISEQ